MARIIKLFAGNLAFFLLFVLTLNLVTASLYDAVDWWSARMDKRDKRLDLPNFVDKERAHQVFSENRQIKRGYMPFSAWSRTEFAGETIHIDEHGDRVHTPPGSGHLGHVRFFGGSTTWGYGSRR